MNRFTDNTILPITKQFITKKFNNYNCQNKIGILIIQHLLRDTRHFIQLLRSAGFQIIKVIGIEYSSKDYVLEGLRYDGIDVLSPKFNHLKKTIKQCVEEMRSTKQKIIVHEVGGYCADILNIESRLISSNFMGIIEETKQGLWRYCKLNSIKIPIIHISNSQLKDLEGMYIGEAVANTILDELQNLGRKLYQYKVGVLGLGVIGKAVVQSFKTRGFQVSFYDSDPIKQVQGKLCGHTYKDKESMMHDSHIIIGSTGSRSISYNDLRIAKNNIILVSASSRTIEFPLMQMKKHRKKKNVTSFMDSYVMPWGKTVRIAYNGFPVNFKNHSLPPWISDLMFCQIASCIKKLMSYNLAPGFHRLSDDEEKYIAKLWINNYKLHGN